MIDPEKRRRVMERSMKLGHCICNPKQACPCDLFKEQDVCTCAGERPHHLSSEVRLTTLVENPGCASKISQQDLKQILVGLPHETDPNVLVSASTCDDAGIYQLDEDRALVQSVDVFAPSVDDPYTFGQIAAANSLSDIYAMGGRPQTALAIIGFPTDSLSADIMTEIVRGGIDKMREAGVPVIGGHSINDREIKFGFAVTGVINPSTIVTNANAQPGDLLLLTKPLGVGAIAFAAQLGKASSLALTASARAMSQLNNTAAEVMLEIGVNSATDVTGFGLLGHLTEMAVQSGVTVEVYPEQIPTFPEALDYLSQGIISGAAERNKEYVSRYVTFAPGVSEAMQYLLCDPQTSGGLLMAVPAEKAQALLAALRNRGVEAASIIGAVSAKSEAHIVIKNNQPCCAEEASAEEAAAAPEESPAACCASVAHAECCATPDEAPPETADTPAKESFMAFMGEVMREGGISLHNKELMAIALSLLAKCEPCARIHLSKARAAGAREDEITEAVWMAVAFGGAPTLMFYESLKGSD